MYCSCSLDREVDMVSALITPLTYEGLIDEMMSIENNRIKVDAAIAGEEKDDNGQSTAPPSSNIINSTPSSSKSNAPSTIASASTSAAAGSSKVTVILDNNDLMYSEVRNLSIERLGIILQEKAIKIRERYSNFRENKDASLSEIHDFVKKIPHLTREFKYLQRHINIAGFLKSFTDSREFRDMWQGERGILEGEPYLDAIEEMICADVDRVQMFRALRLLCLQSLTAGGVRTARYEAIKRLIIQNYGYEELFTLINLERAGILKKKDLVLVDGPSVWQGIRKQLKLIDDESSVEGFSYVAAGYSPLLVRLVQCLGRAAGWSSIADAMRLLPGPLLEVTQSAIAEELNDAIKRRPASSGSHQQSDYNIDLENDSLSTKRTMLVVVIGGLTFLEIAAFRYLSRDPAFPYRIIMATTKLVNGNTLLRSLSHNFNAIGWNSKANQT
jgi:vacuolar protein sorting-associated protein 33A